MTELEDIKKDIEAIKDSIDAIKSALLCLKKGPYIQDGEFDRFIKNINQTKKED